MTLHRLFRPLVLILAMTLAIAAGAQESPVATTVRIFTPFNAGGLVVGLASTAELSGSCFTSSVATPERPDAWRCSSDNAILDPCFQDILGDATTLACAQEPFSANVVLLTLTAALPESGASASETPAFSGLPWALELENGQQCTLLTGATAPIAGLRINYGCSDGSLVAGSMDRSLPVWRVFYQAATRSLSLDQTGVVTAWY